MGRARSGVRQLVTVAAAWKQGKSNTGAHPGDSFPLSTGLFHFPQLPARDQVFQHRSLWKTVRFQTAAFDKAQQWSHLVLDAFFIGNFATHSISVLFIGYRFFMIYYLPM